MQDKDGTMSVPLQLLVAFFIMLLAGCIRVALEIKGIRKPEVLILPLVIGVGASLILWSLLDKLPIAEMIGIVVGGVVITALVGVLVTRWLQQWFESITRNR